MKITKLRPQGFCLGVVEALNIVKNIINNPNTKKPIYILGQIIHNKVVIDELTNLGVITINEKNKTRLELLDLINSGTVIFSAHGVSRKVYDKAVKKNLDIIDASCKFVLKVHNSIKEKLNIGYSIIYVGVNNHPESEGILDIDSSIYFVTGVDDIKNLNITNDKIYVTNQTTLGLFDLKNIFDLIKVKYPNAIIDNGICNATTRRQEAVLNQDNADLCIIVGDIASSNTKKLFTISNEHTNMKSIMVETLEDLKSHDLSNVKSINISSGASTPSYVVDEICKYLENL